MVKPDGTDHRRGGDRPNLVWCNAFVNRLHVHRTPGSRRRPGFYQNTPFYPVTELLRELLAWRSDESWRSSSRDWSPRLSSLDSSLPKHAADCSAPESAGTGEISTVVAFTEQQRRRLLAALVEWPLGALGAADGDRDRRFALADPSTLELLQLLVEQGATGALAAAVHGAP